MSAVRRRGLSGRSATSPRCSALAGALIAVTSLAGCPRTGTSSPASAIEILVPEIEPYAKVDDGGELHEIKIAKPDYDAIIDADRIVLRAPTALLAIDYPLHKPASFVIAPDRPPNSYSLRGLVHAISIHYAQVYREEAATATKPAGNAGTLENRGTTDGKYGIWGHHLEDLVLEHITIRRDVVAGRVIVELHVGS